MFIIIALLVLSIIITVHEFGHFLAAKSLNVGVVEFSIGMGPVFCHKRIGETVYSIRILPIGGFCAMYGEQSVEAKGKGEAKDGGELENRMGFKTDWEPERALSAKSKWQQLFVMIAGPLFNILLAWLASFILTFTPNSYLGQPVVLELSNDVHVAEEAGILPGDVILAVEGREVKNFQDFSVYLSTHPAVYDTGYTMVLKRPDSDGNGTPDVYQVFIKPDAETRLIGITMKGTSVGPTFLDHVTMSAYNVRHWALVCTDSLAMLFRGDAKISDLSGVVGITSFVGTAVEDSIASAENDETGETNAVMSVFTTLLSILTFISVNLGIVNMLPLPALDGGHSLICVIEGIAKRDIPEKALNVINAVGFAMIFGLFGVTLIADIARLVM